MHIHGWIGSFLQSVIYLLTHLSQVRSVSFSTSTYFILLSMRLRPHSYSYQSCPFMIIIIHSFTGWLASSRNPRSSWFGTHLLFFVSFRFVRSISFFLLHGTVTVIATIVYILIVIWLAGFLFVIPEHFQRRVCCDATSTYCTFHPSSLFRDEIARIFPSIIPSELAGYCE